MGSPGLVAYSVIARGQGNLSTSDLIHRAGEKADRISKGKDPDDVRQLAETVADAADRTTLAPTCW